MISLRLRLVLLLPVFSLVLLAISHAVHAQLVRKLLPRHTPNPHSLAKRNSTTSPAPYRPIIECQKPPFKYWRLVFDPIPKDLCLEPEQQYQLTWELVEATAEETPSSDILSAEIFSRNVTAGLWTYAPAVKTTPDGHALAFCATNKKILATMPSRDHFRKEDLAPLYKSRWGFELQVWSDAPDPKALTVIPEVKDIEVLGFIFADNCKSLTPTNGPTRR